MGRSVVDADASTRAYLLGEAREFRRLMCATLLDDAEHGEQWAQFASDQLSGRVDAIESGRAVWFHRFELPPGHALSAPAAGHPCDTLEIGEDNVIREEISRAPSIQTDPVRRSWYDTGGRFGH
jgi:hypothetical protein